MTALKQFQRACGSSSNPTILNKYGIGLEQVRSVLTAANSNTPKGHFSDEHRTWEVGANDQIFTASDYRPLIVAYQTDRPCGFRT